MAIDSRYVYYYYLLLFIRPFIKKHKYNTAWQETSNKNEQTHAQR